MKAFHQAVQQALEKIEGVQAQLARCDAAIQAAAVAPPQLEELQSQRKEVLAQAFLADKPADTKALDTQIKPLQDEHDRLNTTAEAARAAKESLEAQLQAAQHGHAEAQEALREARYEAVCQESKLAAAAYDEVINGPLREAIARVEALSKLTIEFGDEELKRRSLSSTWWGTAWLRHKLKDEPIRCIANERGYVSWKEGDPDGVAAAREEIVKKLQLDA